MGRGVLPLPCMVPSPWYASMPNALLPPCPGAMPGVCQQRRHPNHKAARVRVGLHGHDDVSMPPCRAWPPCTHWWPPCRAWPCCSCPHPSRAWCCSAYTGHTSSVPPAAALADSTAGTNIYPLQSGRTGHMPIYIHASSGVLMAHRTELSQPQQ